VSVTATGGRSDVFAPDPDAPERCRDRARDCPCRRHETLIDRFEGGGRTLNASRAEAAPEDRDDTCVHAPGADIDDHAVVTVRYEGGLIATLFFAIFGPFCEDQETLEVVGTSGRLRMERHSGAIDLVEDHGRARATLRFADPDRGSSHLGADRAPVRRLARLAANGSPVDPRTARDP
jgi:predicted dehydrogenase